VAQTAHGASRMAQTEVAQLAYTQQYGLYFGAAGARSFYQISIKPTN